MIEIKDTCTSGTVIRYGNSKREIINRMIGILIANGYNEISIPILQHNRDISKDDGKSYNFKDRENRDLVLSSDYTPFIQELANSKFKNKKNIKLFCISQCFKFNEVKDGSWREYTELGVHVLNPDDKINGYSPCIHTQFLAGELTRVVTGHYYTTIGVAKEEDYYINKRGFEIICSTLGSSCSQVVSGGDYQGGTGFSLSIDRLVMLSEMLKEASKNVET